MTPYRKEYYLKNKERIKKQIKEYKLRNKEKIKEYYLKNREHIKQYYLKNEEHIKKRRKEQMTIRQENEKINNYLNTVNLCV